MARIPHFAAPDVPDRVAAEPRALVASDSARAISRGSGSSSAVPRAATRSVPSPRSVSRVTRIPPNQQAILRSAERSLSSLIDSRAEWGDQMGLQYQTLTGQHKRNLFTALGYPPKLRYTDYRSRYERGDIATRIVNAFPDATWLRGAFIAENERAEETPFEKVANALFDRLELWERLYRADILAGIGRYSVLLIGAPGAPDQPIPKLAAFNPDARTPAGLPATPAVAYLAVYDEPSARISEWETDIASPRYGQPLYYSISTGSPSADGRVPVARTQRVHWSRVIHVADRLLDSDIFGTPILRPIWNRLMDLDKIIGGGAEAMWKRMDPPTQIDIDPEVEMTSGEEDALAEEIDELAHDSRRYFRTRGVKVTPLAMPVAAFGPNAMVVVRLVAGTIGIPQRLLLGSERGELASEQDRDNWGDRVNERRFRFALLLVRTVLDRFIEYGLLPAPAALPFVIWPRLEEQTETEKASIIGKIASANAAHAQAGLPPVLTHDEIRDKVYGSPPLDPDKVPRQEPMPAAGAVGTGEPSADEPPAADDEPSTDTAEPRVNAAEPHAAEPVNGRDSSPFPLT